MYSHVDPSKVSMILDVCRYPRWQSSRKSIRNAVLLKYNVELNIAMITRVIHNGHTPEGHVEYKGQFTYGSTSSRSKKFTFLPQNVSLDILSTDAVVVGSQHNRDLIKSWIEGLQAHFRAAGQATQSPIKRDLCQEAGAALRVVARILDELKNVA